MATSAGRNSSSAQSFECAICLERLRVPKALPCLHTFCLTCLQRHIKSTVTSKAAKNIRFLCPECRVECSPPNPKKPVEEWAAQFPSNFHLQRLIDAESAEASNEMQRGQQNIPGAEFARRLKDFRSFVDNALLKLGAVQQRLTTERARVANTYDQSKDRLKEVFNDMISVMKARENELEGRLDKDYLKYMQQMIHQEESVETKMKHLRQYSDNITNVMTTGRQSESSLGFDMADTMRQLDREHRDMTNDVNFTCQQPCQSLVISPAEVATILSSITKLGTFTSDTRAPSDSRKDDQPPPLPPRPPHAQRQVSSSRSQTQTQLRTAPSSHEYRPQMSVPSATQTRQRGSPSALTDQLERYNLNSEGDTREPFVTGVCFVAGHLLLTDVNNRSVKGFCLPPGVTCSRLDDLQLRTNPLCICRLGLAHAVVGSERRVYVLRVNCDTGALELAVKEVLETTRSYYGIAALPDGRSVAACSDDPPVVDVIDLHTSHITRTISKSHAGATTTLFTKPLYLAALPQGLLVVSDKDSRHLLTWLTVDGDVVYRYPAGPRGDQIPGAFRLTWPLGVSRSVRNSGGGVLVVDAEEHDVFHVSVDGKEISRVVHDPARLRSPSALCVDEEGGRLFVVCSKGQALIVYRLVYV